MKKTGAMILLVILCLLAASFALAENGPVVRGGQFAAYTDGDGRLYLPGRAEPINMRLVNDIVAIDAYRVLFTAANEALATQDLYMIDLESFQESLAAQDVYDACLADEDTVYYVTRSDRQRLIRLDLADMKAVEVYAAGEAIDSMKWSEVIGTIAGDNTLLIITRSEEAAQTLMVKFNALLND